MPLESKEVIIWAELSLLFPLPLLRSVPCLHFFLALVFAPPLTFACSSWLCVCVCQFLTLNSVQNFNLGRVVWPWWSHFSALCFSFPVFMIGSIITPCRGTLSIERQAFIKENDASNQWWAVSPTLWVWGLEGGQRLGTSTIWSPSDASESLWWMVFWPWSLSCQSDSV